MQDVRWHDTFTSSLLPGSVRPRDAWAQACDSCEFAWRRKRASASLCVLLLCIPPSTQKVHRQRAHVSPFAQLRISPDLNYVCHLLPQKPHPVIYAFEALHCSSSLSCPSLQPPNHARNCAFVHGC